MNNTYTPIKKRIEKMKYSMATYSTELCAARAYALASIEIEIAEGDEMAELNHKAGSCARSCVAARTRPSRRLRFSSAIE